MRRVELSDATAPLSDYARRVRRGPVVITRRGRPLAVLRPLTASDWEDLVVSTDPAFVELMRRSYQRFKPGTGVPLEEIEREFRAGNARRARFGVALRDAGRKRRPSR